MLAADQRQLLSVIGTLRKTAPPRVRGGAGAGCRRASWSPSGRGTGTVVIRAVRVISYTEARTAASTGTVPACPPRGNFGYLNAAQMSTRT